MGCQNSAPSKTDSARTDKDRPTSRKPSDGQGSSLNNTAKRSRMSASKSHSAPSAKDDAASEKPRRREPKTAQANGEQKAAQTNGKRKTVESAAAAPPSPAVPHAEKAKKPVVSAPADESATKQSRRHANGEPLHQDSQKQRRMDPDEPFVGPGPDPAFSADRCYRCFEEDNGLLFRLVSKQRHMWAFYNDTTNYRMYVCVTFGPDSVVRPIGDTKEKTIDQETGECQLTLDVGPGETKKLMRGEYSGYLTCYDAVPLRGPNSQDEEETAAAIVSPAAVVVATPSPEREGTGAYSDAAERSMDPADHTARPQPDILEEEEDVDASAADWGEHSVPIHNEPSGEPTAAEIEAAIERTAPDDISDGNTRVHMMEASTDKEDEDSADPKKRREEA